MRGNLTLRTFVKRFGIGFASLIFLRALSAPTADLAYLVLIAYALRSRGHAIEALLLSFIFTNLNPAIFPTASTGEVARYLVVIAAAFSVFRSSAIWTKGKIDQISVSIFLFTIFIVTHSCFFSAVPFISFLKSMIWGIAFLTLLQGWRESDNSISDRIEFRIYVTLAGCVVLSLLLLFQPAAYVPRTPFLQGVFGHSQLLGLVSATILVWTFSRAISERRPSLLSLGLLVIAGITVLETTSRTALLSSVLVMLLVVVIGIIRKGNRASWSLPGLKSSRFILISVLAGITLFAASDVIQTTLLKRSAISEEEFSLYKLYSDSRGGLAQEMWANIQNDPFVGVGFGLASNLGEMDITYFRGVPISAVVEKGITLLAVWEEVGLFGLLLFLIVLIQMLARSFVLGPDKLAVFLVIFLLNFGEATLLSAGGAGLIQLVLLGWVISGSRRPRARSTTIAYQNA